MSLDLNFSGYNFVAGQRSDNIDALTPEAELLGFFKNMFISIIYLMQKNSYSSILGFYRSTTKIYYFFRTDWKLRKNVLTKGFCKDPFLDQFTYNANIGLINSYITFIKAFY